MSLKLGLMRFCGPGDFRGIMTARSPMALPAGFFPDVKNLRGGEGLPRVRNGTSALGTVIANGTLRGLWQGYIYSSYTIFAAVAVGGEILVYSSTDGGTWVRIASPRHAGCWAWCRWMC